MLEFQSKPWGYYITLEDVDGHKKKLLCIKAGHRTSLQSHENRSEKMCRVSGDGSIVIYENGIAQNHNDFGIHIIPPRTKHRLDNTDSTKDMYIFEEQFGSCDENDIVRYEDDYERNTRLCDSMSNQATLDMDEEMIKKLLCQRGKEGLDLPTPLCHKISPDSSIHIPPVQYEDHLKDKIGPVFYHNKVDIEDFPLRRDTMTRYDKKMIRPDFYDTVVLDFNNESQVVTGSKPHGDNNTTTKPLYYRPEESDTTLWTIKHVPDTKPMSKPVGYVFYEDWVISGSKGE